MASDKKYPRVTRALVEEMERLFPDNAPADPMMSISDIWYAAGKAAAVRKLRSILEEQIAEARLSST